MPGELDPWNPLRRYTPSRIGLGRQGDAPELRDVLAFQLAHAQARDAVHAAVDFAALAQALEPTPVIAVASAAPDRSTFLRRPDLGRRLDPASAARLTGGPYDVVFVIADGLSATAVQNRAVSFVRTVLSGLKGVSVAPIVLASQARVALGDEIGERLQARLCVMLIGERPGLTVADSLGVYMTYDPRSGRQDSERNCISNIHAAGLDERRAANKLIWLMSEAMRLGCTGVRLKDDIDDAVIASSNAATLLGG